MRFHHFSVSSLVAYSVFVVLLAILSGGCGNDKAAWGAKLKEMCAKDGGVTILERVPISKADVDRRVLPMSADGMLGVAIKELAHPDAPVYAEETITHLRGWDPRVSRLESLIRRRADGAVVAKLVVYGRWGGDVPSPAHESSFACPDIRKITTDLHALFVVGEVSK